MPSELRRLAVVLVASAALVGGCGDDESENDAAPGTTTTTTFRATKQANAAYERAFSDCSSHGVARLAAKYKVKQNRAAVAQAVGDAWAKYLGGGESTAAYGEAGCKEGFKSRSDAA